MHATYDKDQTPNVMRRTFRDDGHHLQGLYTLMSAIVNP